MSDVDAERWKRVLKLSDSAGEALRQFLSESGQCIRLGVNHRFEVSLELTPAEGISPTVVVDSVPFVVDRESLARSEGISIDYRNGPSPGFVIDNPNAPPIVVPIESRELKARLDSGEFVHFFDVRTPEERDIAMISGTRLLDDGAVAHIETLDKGTPLVFH